MGVTGGNRAVLQTREGSETYCQVGRLIAHEEADDAREQNFMEEVRVVTRTEIASET